MKATVTITVRPRWWVRHYLTALQAFCALMGTEPDVAKVGAFIARHGVAIRVRTQGRG